MLNIGVLVSGGGTNLQKLIDAQAAGQIVNGQLRVVIASRPDAYALERAKKAGIEAIIGAGRCHVLSIRPEGGAVL